MLRRGIEIVVERPLAAASGAAHARHQVTRGGYVDHQVSAETRRHVVETLTLKQINLYLYTKRFTGEQPLQFPMSLLPVMGTK